LYASDLQVAALSAILNLTGSSSHRVGGAGGGGVIEIVKKVLELKGLKYIVSAMCTHQMHEGVQQQACSVLLAMAEQSGKCRIAMVRAGVKEAVMAAIQCDVLCEMRISLLRARNLLELLRTEEFAKPNWDR
jgi:hypothetical protein